MMFSQSYGSFKTNGKLHLERMVRSDTHWCHLNSERQRGENNHHAKLGCEQIEDIRIRYATGTVSQFVLADEFHVAQTTISAIVRRWNWKE